VNTEKSHSTYNLHLVTLNGNEVVVEPPLIVYKNGSKTPLAPSMKVGSLNGTLTSQEVSGVSGKDSIVYSLPVESFSWVSPSAKVTKKATTSAGKFKQSQERK